MKVSSCSRILGLSHLDGFTNVQTKWLTEIVFLQRQLNEMYFDLWCTKTGTVSFLIF